MNEIYWITRLDEINIILGLIMVINIAIACFFFLGYLISGCKVTEYDFTKNDLNTLKKFSLYSILSSILFVFTPSQKDMFMIWGIGGTIDYIKSNDTAKQLPDKCIQALDKFVDEYMLNEENNKEK